MNEWDLAEWKKEAPKANWERGTNTVNDVAGLATPFKWKKQGIRPSRRSAIQVAAQLIIVPPTSVEINGAHA
jgi:hypothetical protein